MSETVELSVITFNGEKYVNVAELLAFLRVESKELRSLDTSVSRAKADYINDLTVRLATVRKVSK